MSDQNLLETLNNQLLLLDRENGSDAIAGDVVRAISTTMDLFVGDKSNAAMLSHLIDLHDLMLEMRPRMANVISDIQLMIVELKRRDTEPDALRARLPRMLQWKEQRKRVAAERAATLIQSEQTVLLHSYSGTLEAALQIAAAQGRKPLAYVAEQEHARTGRIVKSLTNTGVPFRVVSEYSLSHVVERLNLALFTALTLNADEELIMAPGSANVINLLGPANVPTYATLTTNKWSYWTDDASITWRETRRKSIAGVEVEKEVFSHDWIALDRVTGVITEDAVLTPSEVRAAYAAKRDDFLEIERQIKDLRSARAMSMHAARLPEA